MVIDRRLFCSFFLLLSAHSVHSADGKLTQLIRNGIGRTNITITIVFFEFYYFIITILLIMYYYHVIIIINHLDESYVCVCDVYVR